MSWVTMTTVVSVASRRPLGSSATISQPRLLAISWARASASDWARRFGLGDALQRPAPVLSGGEKQKLALARALIRRPDILFLDEPCANLDGRATREIEALLQVARDAGTRIVMATHDMGQARRLASEVVFMYDGRVHETGPARRFFETPATAQAAAFINGDIVE